MLDICIIFWYEKSVSRKKQIKGVPFSSLGIGGIFLHSSLTSLTLIDYEKCLWKREKHEGHRKVRTPYDESKKI